MAKRNTIQRELVLNAVIRLQNHASASEVYSEIAADHPTISRGTVYRNLNVLAENGDIRRISVPDGPDRFDHICQAHPHVQCLRCGALFDVEMDSVPDLTAAVRDSCGVQIMDYNILFKGLCPACQKLRKENT